ncbi:hypothetical protein LTR09_001295 [Extremus antarcticus]|uniref:Uncharacterized protein n=1 Tax=Extremus antarcticus TaxID=702011 RepID=A0AAJ0GIG9_9PEZI|nr:hypothetical protein LTR09_001295 [Extremus antarcticus]
MSVERADPGIGLPGGIGYTPGQLDSQQDLFTTGVAVTVSPPYTQQETHRLASVAAAGRSPRRTFRAAEPFPPARLRSLSWTPGVHRGPADSASMASSSNLSRLSRASPLQAPQPDLARQFLERGQPEGARDPDGQTGGGANWWGECSGRSGGSKAPFLRHSAYGNRLASLVSSKP